MKSGLRREMTEVLIGALVLAVAIAFVAAAFRDRSGDPLEGYRLTMEVDNAIGISKGSPVRMAGIEVGRVVSLTLDPNHYAAVIAMDIDSSAELPLDSSARVLPDGLIGSAYIELEPGGDIDYLEDGDAISFTQGAVNVIDLIAKVVMSPDADKK